MKFRLALICGLILCSAVSGFAAIGDSGGFGSSGSSSGGGIGGATAVDPTLSTGNGVIGLNITPEQEGAKGNVVTYYAGAMDNNSTANLTDTTNAPFTAGDVGKLICVNTTSASTVTDQAGTRHVETCGTISSVTSASVAVLSFQNASGGAISGVQYAYGTNDTTAVQAAETAVCNAGGGTVWMAGTYGMNTTLTMCTTATVNLRGLGTNMMYASGGAGSSDKINKIHAGMWWLTKSLSGHGVAFASPSGNTQQRTQDTISDVSILAGVGAVFGSGSPNGNYDGGSTTSAGVGITNWNNVRLDNVNIAGWGFTGIYIDVLANSVNDYVAVVDLNRTHVYANKQGIQIGSNTTQGFTGFIQNVHLHDSQILNNLQIGINLIYNNIYNLNIDGGCVIQGNDEAASTSYAEIAAGSSVAHAIRITGNYFELDWNHDSGVNYFPQSGNSFGPYVEDNTFTCTGSNEIAIALGQNSSNNTQGALVKANKFSGCSSSINFTAVINTTSIGNNCPSAGCDGYDYYATSGALGAQITQTGMFGSNGVTGLGTAGISGGGSLSTGSNSFAGMITGTAATGNVLTPGFTCAHDVIAALQDDTTAGGAKVTAQSATTVTFSATASDTVEYITGCR